MDKFFAFLLPTPWNEGGKIRESFLRWNNNPDEVGGQYNGYVAVHKSTKFYQETKKEFVLARGEEGYPFQFYTYTPNVCEELTYGNEFSPTVINYGSFITSVPNEAFTFNRVAFQDKIRLKSDWYVFGFDTGHIHNRWSVDTYEKVKADTLALLDEIKSYED